MHTHAANVHVQRCCRAAHAHPAAAICKIQSTAAAALCWQLGRRWPLPCCCHCGIAVSIPSSAPCLELLAPPRTRPHHTTAIHAAYFALEAVRVSRTCSAVSTQASSSSDSEVRSCIARPIGRPAGSRGARITSTTTHAGYTGRRRSQVRRTSPRPQSTNIWTHTRRQLLEGGARLAPQRRCIQCMTPQIRLDAHLHGQQQEGPQAANLPSCAFW